MKSLTRIVISALALGLLMGPRPAQALCPMAQKISATSCAMPCCKTSRAKAAQCPMIRPAQDSIAVSAVRLPSESGAEALPVFQSVTVVPAHAESVQTIEAVPRYKFCSTPQSIPAPPAHS